MTNHLQSAGTEFDLVCTLDRLDAIRAEVLSQVTDKMPPEVRVLNTVTQLMSRCAVNLIVLDLWDAHQDIGISDLACQSTRTGGRHHPGA